MSPEQILLVRSSWPTVASRADALATAFYQHLFAIDGSAARLFAATNMEAQRTKLTQSLAVVVAALDDPDRLLPPLAALGKRHAGYGVDDRHFDTVGDALLWALSDVLGDSFTTEVRDAWARAYAVVASIMRRALERHRPTAATA